MIVLCGFTKLSRSDFDRALPGRLIPILPSLNVLPHRMSCVVTLHQIGLDQRAQINNSFRVNPFILKKLGGRIEYLPNFIGRYLNAYEYLIRDIERFRNNLFYKKSKETGKGFKGSEKKNKQAEKSGQPFKNEELSGNMYKNHVLYRTDPFCCLFLLRLHHLPPFCLPANL